MVKVHALRGVDLKVRNGEIVSIVGPSGSGKSTLLNLLGAMDSPSSGEVLVNNVDIGKLPERKLSDYRKKQIGFVFQFFNLYPTLTAKENVELPMLILEKDVKERETKVLELLEIVGLKKRAEHLPSQLSGGERQRVAIARALANNPTILLADEPTGNLDSKTGLEIMKFLDKLQEEEKITIVMVTHELQIAKYAERIVHVKDGKIINGG